MPKLHGVRHCRDWIGSHQRTFSFLGGVVEIVVPDNLKSGVHKASLYDPDINPTYQDMAEHYGVAVIPARVRAPKDKSKAEIGVYVVERWILAALRNRTFFSLAELNQAIRKLLVRLNDRPFRKLPGSRQEMFASIDQPALRALPANAYTYAEWKKVRVHIDYHVEFERHVLTHRGVATFYKRPQVAMPPACSCKSTRWYCQ